jgi:hypothetical protein
MYTLNRMGAKSEEMEKANKLWLCFVGSDSQKWLSFLH